MDGAAKVFADGDRHEAALRVGLTEVCLRSFRSRTYARVQPHFQKLWDSGIAHLSFVRTVDETQFAHLQP